MGADMAVAFITFPYEGWDLTLYEKYKTQLIEEIKRMSDKDIEEVYPLLFHGNELDESIVEAKEKIRTLVLEGFELFDSREVASIRIVDYLVIVAGGMSWGDMGSTYDNIESLSMLIDYHEGEKKKRIWEWVQ